MKRLSVAPRLTLAFLPIAPAAAITAAPALDGAVRETNLLNLKNTARKYDAPSIPDAARSKDETAAAEIGGFSL